MGAMVIWEEANLSLLRVLFSTNAKLQAHYQSGGLSYLAKVSLVERPRCVYRWAQISLAAVDSCPYPFEGSETAVQWCTSNDYLGEGGAAQLALWIERYSVIPVCLQQDEIDVAGAYYWWVERHLPDVSQHYAKLPAQMADGFIARSFDQYDRGYTVNAERDWGTAKSFLADHPFDVFGMLVEKLAQDHREAQQYLLASELESRSEDNAVRIYLAQAYNVMGQGQDALGVISPLLTTMPEDTRVWQQYGQALLNMRRFVEAEMPLQKAVRLSPNDLHAMNRLGNLYKASGQYELAEAAFRQALELEGGSKAYWVWEHLGDVLLEEGKRGEAMVAYRFALELSPPERQESVRTKLTSISE